jgi:hypothetical protein
MEHLVPTMVSTHAPVRHLPPAITTPGRFGLAPVVPRVFLPRMAPQYTVALVPAKVTDLVPIQHELASALSMPIKVVQLPNLTRAFIP